MYGITFFLIQINFAIKIAKSRLKSIYIKYYIHNIIYMNIHNIYEFVFNFMILIRSVL